MKCNSASSCLGTIGYQKMVFNVLPQNNIRKTLSNCFLTQPFVWYIKIMLFGVFFWQSWDLQSCFLNKVNKPVYLKLTTSYNLLPTLGSWVDDKSASKKSDSSRWQHFWKAYFSLRLFYTRFFLSPHHFPAVSCALPNPPFLIFLSLFFFFFPLQHRSITF